MRKNTVEDNRTALAELEASKEIPDNFGFGKVVPARFAHIDQSEKGANTLLRDNLPDEAEKLSKTRWGTVNIWRPIKTIYKDPLGVAAAHSVPDSDLVGAALIYPNRKGETYAVKPNPAHQWYYKYGQRPDEVTLIKCYDSEVDRARLTPHSAFLDATSPKEAPHRESIEIRCLVFDTE